MHGVDQRARGGWAGRGPWTAGVASLAAAFAVLASCSTSPSSHPSETQSPDVQKAIGLLQQSDWADALTSCLAAEAADPNDCDGKYCELVARSMQVVNEINTFLLPRYRKPLAEMPGDLENLTTTEMLLTEANTAAEAVANASCEFDLPTLPFVLGDAQDPIVNGEVRGRWTTRDAHVLAALFESISYGLQAEFTPQAVPPPPAGDTVPALPPLLDEMRQHLLAQDALLLSEPADPSIPRGGWLDRNGNGVPDGPDELLVDIFEPGNDTRIFDYSDAEFVHGESLPIGPLTPTASLPPAKCKYQQFHFADVATGANVTTTDGMGFSPDDSQIVFPLLVDGKTQIHTANPDGSNPSCITCTPDNDNGNNDGVRWRPGDPGTMIFISDRDHPYATGNAGGGFGQELYAMHADGSQQTRLTTSDAWATNYHVNWSPDGQHVVWGRTESRAWDVMIADFVSDELGMRLENERRLVHDTTWWETHGFTADNKYVITTNTRAGFNSTDIYAVDVQDGTRIRLTNDPRWDEHAHLSPDGRELAWISGRNHTASVQRLNDGSLAPTFDFLWIIPGIFFEFLNPPAGYSSELTLADADGSNLHNITNDQLVVADNEWSFDGTKIIFRQSDPTGQTTRIRTVTFDDCQ